MLDRWQADYLSHKRKDGGAEIRRSFGKDVLPVLGAVPAEDVTRGMVAALLDSDVRRGSPVIANYLLADMNQMFNFAKARQIIEANPCDGLNKAQFGGAKVERDRVLSEAEIRELRAKIPEAKLQKRTEAALWIMLATGCRVGEISQARWSAVDLEGKVWTIPSDVAKNAKEHRIYLSDFVVKWFEVLKPTSGNSQWVFPAENKEDSHVCVRSITKQIGDRQHEGAPMQNRSLAVASLKLTGGDWTPHVLQRTAATLAGELDFINGFQNDLNDGDILTLATANSAILGSFSNVASGSYLMTNFPLGLQVWYGAGSPYGAENLVVAVPEPSRALLVLAGLHALWLRRRRSVPATA